jgi:hypothetical protein
METSAQKQKPTQKKDYSLLLCVLLFCSGKRTGRMINRENWRPMLLHHSIVLRLLLSYYTDNRMRQGFQQYFYPLRDRGAFRASLKRIFAARLPLYWLHFAPAPSIIISFLYLDSICSGNQTVSGFLFLRIEFPLRLRRVSIFPPACLIVLLTREKRISQQTAVVELRKKFCL